MSYTVTKSSPVLVPPTASTPSCLLSFSSIDRASGLYINFVSVFSHGEQPAARIKDAFAKALIHYYPVAGRITWMKKDALLEPLVNCTGEGIWFVEAAANCTLADVKYFETPYIPKEEILPRPPAGVELKDQILMAQITEFMCGGFSVGIWFNHMVFDGEGAAQFLKAVGEMARGLPEPTVKPVWSRQDITYPPMDSGGHIPSFTTFNFTTLVVDISLDYINRAKDLFLTQTGQTCTTFDAITAMIFKSRVKAINLAQKKEVRLMFATSTRRLLRDMLPSIEGYYGNCVYGSEIIKTSEEINSASLTEVITFVKHSKEASSIEFMDWIDGRLKKHVYVSSDYGMLTVSDWRRIGFNEIDYGWGEPTCVFPHNDDFNLFGCAVYLKPPAPKQGVRVILRCVEDDHKTDFCHELDKIQVM